MAQIGQIGQNFAVLLALACISTAAATTGLPGLSYYTGFAPIYIVSAFLKHKSPVTV